MPGELPKPEMDGARDAFEAALEGAALPYELGQLELFADGHDRYIRQEVERKLYEPQLPNGGDKEREMIKRLKKLANEDWEGSARAAQAIRAWEKVLPADPRNAGRYYARRPVTLRTDKVTHEWATGLRERSHQAKAWDKKWFAQLVLDGPPETASDFRIECLFLLRKSNGEVQRLVQLKNILGEKSRGEHHEGSVLLDEESFAAPEKFRKWALKWGNFSWSGNQNELHLLHEDLNRSTAWLVINRVDTVGWHEVKSPGSKVQSPKSGSKMRSGIWFYEDCAFADGQCLRADDEGVYHWQGEGYYMNEKGRENEFAQRRPRLRPGEKVAKREDGRWWMVEGPKVLSPESKVQSPKSKVQSPEHRTSNIEPRTLNGEGEELREFYQEVCAKFYETLGGYDGWLAMGSMFAYAAAPEIFHESGFFPGLFVHGQMGSGKTQVTEWLMALQGFNVQAGIGLLKGSAVGLLIQSENYSNLALWVDEFREGKVSDDKVAILRDAHNRVPPEKWSPDGVQRRMRTSFVVSGESTSSDAATRSRYPHIQVAANKRIGNHLDWMTEHKECLVVFWRVLMERRVEFVDRFRLNLEEWLAAPGLQGMSEREKRVHGIDWAAFVGMEYLMATSGAETGVQSPESKVQSPEQGTSNLEPRTLNLERGPKPRNPKAEGSVIGKEIEVHTQGELQRFAEFMVAHAKGSAADVTSETNISVFWSDLLTAFKAGEIPLSCFRTDSAHGSCPPGAPNQMGGWRSYRLFLDPDAVISAMSIYLAKARSTLTLRRKDLRDQLSKNPYWLDSTTLRMRFSSGQEVTAAWGVDLDKHPLGYQPVKDAEYERDLLNAEAGDSRKGPLYVIVHKLEAHEQEMAKATR